MIEVADYQRTIRQYCRGVINGTVPAGRLVTLAVRRHIRDLRSAAERGYYFDGEKAGFAIAFFEAVLRHSTGEWKGQPFVLEPWQKFVMWCVYGWRRKSDGTRRFRRVFEEIGRKNGKMLDLQTVLPTPTGWTTMGEIRVGDTLFDERGKPCRVTWVGSVDPSPDSYLMEFSNGETIKACADHQWVTTARVNVVGRREGRPMRRYAAPRLILQGRGKRYATAQLYGRQVYLGRSDAPDLQERFDALAAADIKEHPVGANNLTRVRTTKEIFDTLHYGTRGDRNHSVILPGPLEMPDADLPVSPYVLGVWLGDGHSRDARMTIGQADYEEFAGLLAAEGIAVTGGRADVRSNAFTFTMQVRKGDSCRRGHDSARHANGKGRCLACERETDLARRRGGSLPPETNPTLRSALRSVGVLGDKHIPETYLRSSACQRLALLQGLMDTDGTANADGQAMEFSTTSRRLADGVCELLAGLGVKYSCRERSMRCNGRDVPGVNHRIQFTVFRDQLPVFRLARKLDRMRDSSGSRARPRSRTVQITAVTPCDPVPMRCVSVDSPSRTYLCGRTMIPTHNTAKLAGQGLLLMQFDDPIEARAEIYCAATMEDQAKLLAKEAIRMVKAAPALRSRLKAFEASARIVCPSDDSTFIAIGSNSDTKDGLNPHGVLLDELHAWREHHRGLYQKLTSGGASRRQPLEWIITTAGDDRSELWKEKRDAAVRVLESVETGSVVDDEVFAFIACVDDADDPLGEKFDDAQFREWINSPEFESVLAKANPNIGVSVKVDYLRSKAVEARNDPAERNKFLRYHANRAVSSSEKAIRPDIWAACRGELSTADWIGLSPRGGFDLGRSDDFCSATVLFPVPTGILEPVAGEDDGVVLAELIRYEAISRCWTCEKRSERLDTPQFKRWVRSGALAVHPGDQVDFTKVTADIAEWTREYNVQSWAYDDTFARMVAQTLQEEHGIHIFPFYQTPRNYNEPTRSLLKLIRDPRRFRHDGDELLSWQAGNLAVKPNARDEWMPDKAGSHTNKIDAMVSLIMAYHECLFAENNQSSCGVFVV